MSRMRPGQGSRSESPRAQRRAVVDGLVDWVAVRRGVEVFVEPKTPMTPVTMVLVAHDGEFTRKQVASPEAAKSFARQHRLPIYDATIVGYPQRMRDYSRRQKILQERARRDELGDR
nr:oxidoreductase [Nakamurella panacisegetis]